MNVFAVLDRLWTRLIWLLMAVAAAYVGMIMALIVYVTVFRASGWAYTPYALIAIEYGFVYILFLGSPWLIRTRGHIYIEILTALVPGGVRPCHLDKPGRTDKNLVRPLAIQTFVCFIDVL